MPKTQTSANSAWWSAFHRQPGPDGEEERAFLGYLTTHVPTQPQAALELSPEALDQAWSDFLTYWQASTQPPARSASPALAETRPRVIHRRH